MYPNRKIVEKKRKLSPSGSKAKIVERADGSVFAEITDADENCARISFGALTLLHGLISAVLSGKRLPSPAKPPVRRRLDFDNIFVIETFIEDEECIPCGQRSPLVKLDVALQPGYLHDGWLTSKQKDVQWLSEYQTNIVRQQQQQQQNQQQQQRFISEYLGVSFDVGVASTSFIISPTTYAEMQTPSQISGILSLPLEMIHRIMDNLSIREVLNVTETCNYLHFAINTADFWRHRLLRDFNCYSFSIRGCTDETLPVLRESYKLCYWADDELYGEML